MSGGQAFTVFLSAVDFTAVHQAKAGQEELGRLQVMKRQDDWEGPPNFTENACKPRELR